jgi:hypothetical protein
MALIPIGVGIGIGLDADSDSRPETWIYPAVQRSGIAE